MTVSAVPADAPFALRDRITDRADVLDEAALQSDLETLEEEHDIQLWVVFVDSFDGRSGDQWVQDTYEESGFGGNDVLLAVAVDDRRYGMWTTGDSGLSDSGLQEVQTSYVEPALGDDDWDGAVSAAAQGLGEVADGGGGLGDVGSGTDYSSSGGDSSGTSWFGGLFCLSFLAIIGFGVVRAVLGLVRDSGSDDSRRGGPTGPPTPTEEPAQAAVPTEQLRQQASSALVALDDAIRSSEQELGFAMASYGEDAVPDQVAQTAM